MILWLRDWSRGYSDADMASMLRKVLSGRLGDVLTFTNREAAAYRAYLKKLVLIE